MSATQKFTAILEKHDKSEATAIMIPFDVPAIFGARSRVPVCGTINGFPFRSSIFFMGGRHLMVVNKELRAGANAKAGEPVKVVMERDNAPREVEVPEDLAAKLQENAIAQAAWEKLSYTHRKEHVKAIEEAKKPETRTRRIEKAIEMLNTKAAR